MKYLLLIMVLVMASLDLGAQSPPAFPAPPSIPRVRPPRFGVTNGPVTQPRYTPPALPGTTSAPATSATPAQSVATASAALAAAQPEETIPPGTINFQGVDVNQVLEIYAQLVGRTLLRAQLPDAKIVLKTQTPLTKSEAIQALQAVLALNNISVINIGDKFVKVLPSDQANTAAAELDRSGATNLPTLGSYVTHITQLHYVKPSLMVPLIAPFAKLPNAVYAIDDNGILVIRDYAENVKRMLEMIEQIDVSVPAEYVSEVIPIRYAKVDDIASALNALGGSGGGATVSIGGGSSSGQISGLAGNRSGGGMSGMGGMGGMGGAGGGQYGNQNQYGGMGGNSPFGNRTSAGGATPNPNGTPSGGSTFAQRLNSIINRASSPTGGQQDQIQLFGQTKIIPNESSSSLLIYATRSDMAVIKGIIAKLDVPLAQVLIEAIIMNVSIGHSFNFSVSAAQNPASSGNLIGAGGMNNGNSFMHFMQTVTTNYSSSGSGSNLVLTPIGTSTSVSSSGNTNSIFGNNLGGGLSYFGNIGQTWDLALSAAQSDNNASIIQRPRIQTSQAKAAQFFVGDTVPYVTGNTYGGAYGNSSSYSQLSVGVELDVTPFINPDGLVVMDISQEIDDLNGFTAISGVGNVPNTIKRTLNAEIAVRDRDTIMLGGFIKSDKSHSQSGVPFLSDIPLLGNLFKSRSDTKGRQELIVLVRPTVLQTPELAAKNTVKEKQRLPGISSAASEDSADERALIDAQRKREQKKFKKSQQYDGFFTPEPDGSETNAVPSAANGSDNPDQGKARTTPQNSLNTAPAPQTVNP